MIQPSTGDAGSAPCELSGARRRVVLLVLAAVQFTSIIDFMVVMPLGPELMETLGISPRKFGFIVSSYTFSAGIAGLFAALCIDRFGRRASYLVLFTGFLAGTLLCGLAPGYHALLTARVVTGAFGGILGGMALAIIGDIFPEKSRGSATAWLMSAFALASVAGLPFGLYLGNRFGWHSPFLMLAGLGIPVLAIAAYALPPLRGHVVHVKDRAHPMAELATTLTHPNHLRAFTLMVSLMLGGFTVIPYLSAYLVYNVGVPKAQLPLIYVAGGALTLVAAPLIGKWADRRGKLPVYRLVAPLSAVMILAITNLPRVPVWVAVGAAGLLMMGNAGRMVVAMAMITASVEPRRRGSFMSVNSSVQHMATGLGAYIGGLMVVKAADGSIRHFDRVGVIGVAATLLSLYLAGRLRVASSAPNTPAMSLGAAAEAHADASEPIAAVELL